MIGRKDAASLLKQTLDEEKSTDALLTRIAERNINFKAARGETRSRKAG